MPNIRIRPRIRIETDLPAQKILKKIKHDLGQETNHLVGQVVQEHAFIRFPDSHQQYWTPELHAWVREQEGKTIVYGVIGPKPKIWTMFIFLYTGVLTLTFFGGSYGIIQMMLGEDAPFLWSIPLGLFSFVMLYSSSHYGQYKSRKEMEILTRFLQQAVKDS